MSNLTIQSNEQKFEQSSLTLAVTSTLENAQSQAKASTQTSDARMKDLS